MSNVDYNDPHRLLTPRELAAQLGISPRTVTNWRSYPGGRGPVWTKIGSAVRYRQADVNAWVSANRVETED